MSSQRRTRRRKLLSPKERRLQRNKIRNFSLKDRSLISRIFGSRQEKGVKEQIASKEITGRRLWLFRIISLTIFPILLLLPAELFLRIADYGFFPGAIIKYRADGKEAYCDNVKFGWRFFPRNISRESEPFIFPVRKDVNTYRIFILGASAAQGVPEPAFGFGRILEKMLEDRYPAINFEIVNTAMTAINSHVVLQIAKDSARCVPDLFVVYLGNNEVTGPYGPSTVYTLPLANSTLIRMGIALKATRLGQLLTNLADSTGVQKNTPQEWLGLEMFLDNQVQFNTPALEAVYHNFQRNLMDIRRIALSSHSKIIFCTVGSNLKDNPPFASSHRPGLIPAEKEKWDDIYRQGTVLELKCDYAEAIERYLEAEKIDDSYADIQFRLGRCHWAIADYEKARERYIQARDLDTLRFRADTRINDIIRKAAAGGVAEGIYLTDATEIFEKNSPNATAGQELFYEHVHLNFKGNYYLAKALFEQIEKILPSRLIKYQGAGTRQILTEGECAERLAYTGWDRYRIADKVLNGFIKNPPFTNQLYHQDCVKQMERDIEALKVYLTPEALEDAALKYQQAIKKSSSDWRLQWMYGKFLTEGVKDYQAAVEQCRLLELFLPHSYLVKTTLGAVFRGLGDIDKSIAQYEEALRINPACIYAHFYLAWAYHKQGRIDESIEYYTKTLRLQPTHMEAYNNLVEILFRQDKVDQGIEICRKALRFIPNSAILHCNLGIMLDKQGNRTEALEELNIAIQLDPNSPKIRRAFDVISRKNN
ncbi:MAG: tetratricopeptide repeat protein [Sedimentisphaerales bacterium]|nr:tetratricopeptide repeat protein [Sedimentisphaerales bacterium]